ncbi:LysR family transcriptional regulator [Xenophilus aerolatus]|nr:LysR family transcriptional regulator [Xenophilus aerolatus]
MNWDNAKFFLAVARAGTLRGAAAALGVDQATAGRRLAALEDELAAKLFLRTPAQLVLTAAGEALVQPAESMEQAAQLIERRVAGLDAQLAGTIRIATTDSLGQRFVLPAIAKLRRQHPGIDVHCVTSTEIANLTRREADLAIRSVRPDSPDLVARRMGQLESGLYASRDYLRERGEPRQGEAFAGHDLVIYQLTPRLPTPQALCGEAIARGRIVFRASSMQLVHESVARGVGIAEIPLFRAAADRRLVRVMPRRRERFDIWMVAHADLVRTARIQALIALIAEAFDSERAAASPEG